MHRIQRLILPSLPPSPNRRAAILATLAVSVLGAGSVLRMKEDAPKASVLVPKTEGGKTNLVIVENDRLMKVKSKGKVELKPDSPEIVVVGEGGSFELKVKEGGRSRVFTVSRDAKGETRTYTDDGQPRPLDEPTKAWLKVQVEEVLKHQARTPEPPRHRVEVKVMQGAGKRIEKHIVIDRRPISEEEERRMKEEMGRAKDEVGRMKDEMNRHKDEMERHKILIIKKGDLDIPEVNLEFEDEGDEAHSPRTRMIVKQRMRGAGAKQEAEILRSTIEKLQQRLDRLEEEAETSATTPKPPAIPPTPRPSAVPKPPKAPKVAPAPPAPVEPPAPPAPPAPPSSL